MYAGKFYLHPHILLNTPTFSIILKTLAPLFLSSPLLLVYSPLTSCNRNLLAAPSPATISSELPFLPHHHQRSSLSSPSSELNGLFSSSLIRFSSSLPLPPATTELRRLPHHRRALLSALPTPAIIFSSFFPCIARLWGVRSFRAVHIKKCTAVKPRAPKEMHGWKNPCIYHVHVVNFWVFLSYVI